MRHQLIAAIAVSTVASLPWLDHRHDAVDHPFITSDETIHDPLGALGPLRETIERVIADWREDLGVAVAVAAPEPSSEPLDSRMRSWLRFRSDASRAPTGGVLILMDTRSGRAEIELVEGLAGALLPDLVRDLADAQLAPYLQAGAPAMAVHDVLALLRAAVVERVARGEVELADRFRERPATAREIDVKIEAVRAVWSADSATSAAGDGAAVSAAYEASPDPIESFAAYVRTLRDRNGDPGLSLFTAGTRLQRSRSPLASHEAIGRARAFARSHPFYAIVEGDRAVVLSERPAPGSYPVLLARSGTRWRVDLVEVWKNITFDRGGRAVVYNLNNPYRFGLEGVRLADAELREHAEDDELTPLAVGGDPLAAADRLDERLAAGPDARAHFEMAELLFRNAFLWEEALGHYRDAVREAPGNREWLSVAADRALYLHMYDAAIPWLEGLGAAGLERLAWSHARAGRSPEAIRHYARLLATEPFSMRARRALQRLREADPNP